MNESPSSARRADPTTLETFGEFLKYLRRRARLTQDELGRAVGYSREQINRLERNQRLPEIVTLASLFVPALDLRDEPQLVARFLQLAAQARGEILPDQFQLARTVERRVTVESPSERDAHRAAAEWAELAQGDVIEAARQYGLAGDFKHAADALADQGASLFNQGKAELAARVIDDLLNALRAHHLTAKYPDVMRALLTTRGDLLINTTRAQQAEANYQEALGLAHGAVRAALVYRWGSALAQRGRAAEALALVQETLQQLAPAHRLLRAQLKVVEGGAHMALAHFDAAEQANREALDLAEQLALAMPLPAASVRARANNVLGAIHAIRGNRAQALAYWQAAVATAQLAGMRALEYRAQGNIANVLYEQGDLDAAAHAAQAALAGLKSMGDMQAAAKFIHLLANMAFLRGDLSESLALAREACEIKMQTGDRASFFASLHQQFKALLVLGDWKRARAMNDANLPEIQSLGDERTLGYWLTTLSELEMLEGNVERACEVLERVLRLHGAEDAKLSSDCANHLALAQLMLGHAADAAQQLAAKTGSELETQLERDLISSLVYWKQNERARAEEIVRRVAQRAHTSGYVLLARRAEKAERAFVGELDARALPELVYGTPR